MSQVNDFVVTVATANGSGSQSANNIFARSLFRMGVPVGAKNLFPSNIQGLPTWFTIRANEQGFTARKKLADVVVAMNSQTVLEDLQKVRPGGWFFINSEIRVPETSLRNDVHTVQIPFRDIVAPLSSSIKLRKLLNNVIYVGILAELLQIPDETLHGVVDHQFKGKTDLIDTNKKALDAGRTYAREHLKELNFPFRAEARPEVAQDKVFIDGNTSAAMGLIFGGCTFVSWYPITPSSSLVENFAALAEKYRLDENGKRNFAVVQAEDELASAAMVLGAGWAGARAMTATSGPGLSLMSEAAGLAYYAEIPSVIWNVQRVGPSTGLPTRTMQGDLLAAYYLSHGDTKHVVLLPGTPNECFEFGQLAFDLAEQLQTLVIVLSDLDIGMNFHAAQKFSYPEKPFARGKVLSAEELEKVEFQRYQDCDGDGIPYRTLTGTSHPQAAYFTRGTGHDTAGRYSEDPEVYRENMERLSRKFQTAARLVPQPVSDIRPDIKIGFLVYGSSHEAVGEARYILQQEGLNTNCMRIRALPLTTAVEEFLNHHDRVYVIEQNRDAQLMTILRSEMPQYWNKCRSVLHFDGLPLDAETICEQVRQMERDVHGN